MVRYLLAVLITGIVLAHILDRWVAAQEPNSILWDEGFEWGYFDPWKRTAGERGGAENAPDR